MQKINTFYANFYNYIENINIHLQSTPSNTKLINNYKKVHFFPKEKKYIALEPLSTLKKKEIGPLQLALM